MNSGVLAILTHQNPYQFPGLQVISTIFYILDLLLFITFSAIFIARFVVFKGEAYQEIVSNQSDLMLMACWPIAWMTLTTLTTLIVSNAPWGGYAWSLVGYVMWWIALTWSLLTLLWVFINLIDRHEASDRRIPTMIIIPAVSVSTVSVTGALVVSLSDGISPRLAVPVIIVSFMTVGIGILLGLILSSYLFHGLLAQGWPVPAQTASMFILVGPMGQSAAALQALGMAARVYNDFGGYNRGRFLTAEAAVSMTPALTVIALMLSGLGVIWTLLSTYLMLHRALQRNLPWSPGWNAIIFPVGTLTTSFSLFALDMDSPAWRVLTSGMIIILLAVFLLNVVQTLLRISQGKLLIVREDPRVKKQIEEAQKEK